MYTVGIIGLGSIAEGYGSPEDPNSYCHAGGIQHSDTVKLVAVADLREDRRDNFRDKWGGVFPDISYYCSDSEMLAAEDLDIIAVCVRGPDHFSVMQGVIAAGPKAIFLEKPPTCSLEQMDEMVAAAKAKSIPITVSYSRHWAPHILRMQELVRDEGLIGEVQTVVGYCGHTFLSFASHTTDLICQFAGYCPTAVFGRGHITENAVAPEGYEPEPSVDLMSIEFANGVTGAQIGREGEHGTFYCDVFGSEGMARVGMYMPPFAKKGDGTPIDLSQHGLPPNASVFTIAYGQIADHLDGGALPHCTDSDFTTIHEVGFAGIESALTGKRIELPNANRTRRVFANG